MAYIPFDYTKPDPSTQDGTEAFDSTRENMLALVDKVAAGEDFEWDEALSGGTAEQPAISIHSTGTKRIKEEFTWGTTGGEDGNVIQTIFSYSSDSGGNYDVIKTVTYSFDSNGNYTGKSGS